MPWAGPQLSLLNWLGEDVSLLWLAGLLRLLEPFDSLRSGVRLDRESPCVESAVTLTLGSRDRVVTVMTVVFILFCFYVMNDF